MGGLLLLSYVICYSKTLTPCIMILPASCAISSGGSLAPSLNRLTSKAHAYVQLHPEKGHRNFAYCAA